MNFFFKAVGATCASVIALGVSSVNAADLYQGGGLKDLPVEPSLAGWYVGINGGGSFGASNNITLSNSRDSSQADIGQFDRDSGFGGIQLGYLSQGFGWGGHIAIGLETDFQGSGIDSSFTRSNLNYDFAPAYFNANQSIDFFGTVRARVGYTVDRAFVYVTGGWAYAGTETSVNINHGYNSIKQDAVQSGYAVGGGVEYLLTPCWSVRAEYLYIDLNGPDTTQTLSGIASDGSIDHFNVSDNFNIVRVGLNYRFIGEHVPLK